MPGPLTNSKKSAPQWLSIVIYYGTEFSESSRSFCFRYLSELDAHPGRSLQDPALATCAWWKPSRYTHTYMYYVKTYECTCTHTCERERERKKERERERKREREREREYA